MNKEEFDEAMAEELGKWSELGVQPGAYQPGEGFLGLIFRFEVLSNLLKQKGIITEEEADEEYRGVALSGLAKVRETVIEPAVAEAKQQAARTKIVGPNGMPMMKIPKKKP